MKKNRFILFICTIAAALMLTSCDVGVITDALDIAVGEYRQIGAGTEYSSLSADSFPDYSGEDRIIINGNEPYFADDEYVPYSFEYYSDLDYLGRCGAAYANLGSDLMPQRSRGNISAVKPSGWRSVRYDFVEGKSLYNRSHLIGWQLAGEDANEKNLITGTRHLNATLMLPFENMVADYIKETDCHVLYRVTPFFKGDNLVCKGVLMEARSVEDDGDGICYNVFLYNVQPGVEIDYATGKSRAK